MGRRPWLVVLLVLAVCAPFVLGVGYVVVRFLRDAAPDARPTPELVATVDLDVTLQPREDALAVTMVLTSTAGALPERVVLPLEATDGNLTARGGELPELTFRTSSWRDVRVDGDPVELDDGVLDVPGRGRTTLTVTGLSSLPARDAGQVWVGSSYGDRVEVRSSTVRVPEGTVSGCLDFAGVSRNGTRGVFRPCEPSTVMRGAGVDQDASNADTEPRLRVELRP